MCERVGVFLFLSIIQKRSRGDWYLWCVCASIEFFLFNTIYLRYLSLPAKNGAAPANCPLPKAKPGPP